MERFLLVASRLAAAISSPARDRRQVAAYIPGERERKEEMNRALRVDKDVSTEVRTSLSKTVTRTEVEELFQIFLDRSVGNDDYTDKLIQSGITVSTLIRELRNCEEFANKRTQELGVSYSKRMIDRINYRTPDTLQVSGGGQLRSVLLIGSCLMDPWPKVLSASNNNYKVDLITFNNASLLPRLSREEVGNYDLQICQIPLRSILPEREYLNIGYDDNNAYELLMENSKQALLRNFDEICRYNKEFNILTFVLSFATPQQNPMGRLQNRYYLGNLTYFIEELNRYMFGLISERRNCYMIDFNEILSTFGKKYYLDDVVTHFNHSSYITGLAVWDDHLRLEPTGSVYELYTPMIDKIVQAVLSEAQAGLKTVRQLDAVKLVIFDLDDTLWRGVGAEHDDIDTGKMTEGWPLSIVEAASYLWRRGILIAIVSKNDEKTALQLWEKLYGGRFSIKNFVATRINWNPKAVNIAEILKDVNLLPGSVLFVDDNPVERAAVKAAFPDIRVMDAPLAHWRRILLWAPELQQPLITLEILKAHGDDPGTNRTRGRPPDPEPGGVPQQLVRRPAADRDCGRRPSPLRPMLRVAQQDEPVQHHRTPLEPSGSRTLLYRGRALPRV